MKTIRTSDEKTVLADRVAKMIKVEYQRQRLGCARSKDYALVGVGSSSTEQRARKEKISSQIMMFLPRAGTYGKESKNAMETEATFWELVLVKPHAPVPGTKLNTIQRTVFAFRSRAHPVAVQKHPPVPVLTCAAAAEMNAKRRSLGENAILSKGVQDGMGCLNG